MTSELQHSLPNHLQENLLILLVFDEEACPILVNSLKPGMFDSEVYKQIASKAIQYYNSYKEPPQKHIADLLQDYLENEDSKISQHYTKILSHLFENKEDVNRVYCLNSLNAFIYKQTLKNSVIEAMKFIRNDEIEQAESVLNQAKKQQIESFEPGIWLPDSEKSLKFFDTNVNVLPTGIKSFDDLHFGPAPGELFVILAPPNRGKSIAQYTKIWNPDIGYVQMKELIGKKGFNVFGVNISTGQPEINKNIDVFSSGVKPVCDIKLKSGRVIKGLADTHPILTYFDYKCTKDLKVGDFVMGSSKLPLNGSCDKYQIDDCYSIGVFLGDGSLTGHSPILSVNDKDLDIAEQVILNLSGFKSPRIEYEKNYCKIFFKSDSLKFIENYDLEKSLSIHKKVPRRIYELGEEAVSSCLIAMFDTDGSVYNEPKRPKHWRVEFSTSSYELSEDILTILNVLGIYATRRIKLIYRDKKEFTSYGIYLNDSESINLFYQILKKYSHCERKLKLVEKSIKELEGSKSRGQYYKRVPYHVYEEISEKLKGSSKRSKKTIKNLYDFYNPDLNNRVATSRVKRALERKLRMNLDFAQIAGDYIESEKLKAFSTGAFIFDEIEEIIWKTPEPCWDMETETTHQSFLCEHVFTHNTFAMIHFGKTAARMRLKVLHISLEMSEEKMSQRYNQSLFSYTKRKTDIRYATFKKDELGRLNGLSFEELSRPSLEDSNAKQNLVKKLDKFKNRLKIYIKRFPTNSLTILGLENYLDNMERQYNFVPDLLLVDYADLMKLDNLNVRIDTGILYKELRRIAIERNIAVVTASQSNRLGEDSKVITLKHMAEDYSKAATADNIIAYCQTQAEARLGLARLFVAKARDEERELSILISQCYRMGQFHVQDIMMQDNYWNSLDSLTGGNSNSDEDENSSRKRNLRRKDQN